MNTRKPTPVDLQALYPRIFGHGGVLEHSPIERARRPLCLSEPDLWAVDEVFPCPADTPSYGVSGHEYVRSDGLIVRGGKKHWDR